MSQQGIGVDLQAQITAKREAAARARRLMLAAGVDKVTRARLEDFASAVEAEVAALEKQAAAVTSIPASMTEQDEEDLEKVDAAIARVKQAIERDLPTEEERQALSRELAILIEMRRKIAGPLN